ncbi:sensor histidine kinase [Arsenicicoccus dermatophilus]|uniref:sensor histidine kinase n=1 Tax=Arsenicicoccus dermatophilus TaxID=1076331 RepID=UPI003916FEAC
MLVDRGLAAALEELAGRAAIPTTLDVVAPRVDPGLETAVSFVVTEALTNAAKHSGAAQAQVRVRQEGPWLTAEVRDDGVGGARVGAGTGLLGLAQRVEGVGGRLVVDSPEGGPTVIRAEVPCIS